MEYRLNHTLEHKSKFQKALSLWQDNDIIDKILSYYHHGTYRDIPAKAEFERELLNGVMGSVNNTLPRVLQADLFETIDSVGKQILKYTDMLVDKFYESAEEMEPICIENIFWTEDGIIDRLKSLKYLMDNTKHIHLENIYRLSCVYCMDQNWIDGLWMKLPEEVRGSNFYESDIYNNPNAIVYWKHYRNGTVLEIMEDISVIGDDYCLFNFNDTFEENWFRYSVAYGPNECAKFLYHKIPEDEQQQSLLRAMKIILSGMQLDADIILFVLSEMNDENRLYIIHEFPHKILKPLLDSWPWRNFYMSVFDKLAYLTEDTFLTIINDILESIKRAVKFSKLKIQFIFSEIWNKNISKKYKKCINFFQAFMVLLEAGDIENVVLIAVDKESENVSLIHLAFLIIRVKYSHLVEKFEDLVNEKIKPENIDDGSLKYCLSEFLINEEYEAVTEILSWYFGNRQEELDKFKSNFPINTVLKEVWKNKSEISPIEQSEKVLECIVGKDEKMIEVAKRSFSEDECLFEVYSFLLNNNRHDRIEEIVAWLKIMKDYESNLKSRFVHECLTDTCMKLISKVQIHFLNKLVDYLFDNNPEEFIKNFILNYGVQCCIAIVTYVEVLDTEKYVDEDLISDQFLLYAEFIDTWMDWVNLKDTLYGKLTTFGKPNKHSDYISPTNNIFEPDTEALKKWAVIDENYRVFMRLCDS